MKQQTKVFHDGKLVEVTTKTVSKKKHDEVVDQARALKAQQKLMFDTVVDLETQVRILRKQLIRAEYLAKARTRERDALREGHRRRLEQVNALTERNDDLKAELYAIKSDIEAGAYTEVSEEESTTPIDVDERPRGVAARAVRK